MAENRIDPSEDIPEADLLDQQIPLDPNALVDAEPELIPDSPGGYIDEADRLEQQAVLPDDGEDDYPHDPPGAGSS